MTIAELEYLFRRFQELQALKTPLPFLLSRVLLVLFQADDTSKLTFEAFLQVFHSWKVSSAPEKLDSKSFLLMQFSSGSWISLMMGSCPWRILPIFVHRAK